MQTPTIMHIGPKTPLIRVVVVEDDVVFLNAFTGAIAAAADMALSGAFSTVAAALAHLATEPADVLLVDLGLPDGSGIEVIRAAHARWPECAIMVCTTFADELHVVQSIEAGASGYLLKDSSPERVASEIRSLHAGGSPISPLIARQVLMRFRATGNAPAATQPAGEARAALSARELEVLNLITKGYTYDEIAGLLQVTRNTVMTFVRRIYTKLEVNSKAEAIHEARSQGLLGG